MHRYKGLKMMISRLRKQKLKHQSTVTMQLLAVWFKWQNRLQRQEYNSQGLVGAEFKVQWLDLQVKESKLMRKTIQKVGHKHKL